MSFAERIRPGTTLSEAIVHSDDNGKLAEFA